MTNEFGRMNYGQPCRECGFSWDMTGEEAEVLIASLPANFARELAGHDGSRRLADAPWNAAAYVWHVADNLRIWSERLAELGLGGKGLVVPYDQDELGQARSYESLPLRPGLWAMDRAAADWRAARQLIGAGSEAVLHHPEMGDQQLAEVSIQVAHDGAHHLYDVRRAVGT